MITLTYGFKQPQTGDKGSVFFPALEDNIEALNDHTHNGTNSAKLTAAASVVVSQSILAASWVATSNGTYRQLVTIPGTLTAVSDVRVSFRDATTLDEYHLKVEKASATTYYVYINDNSIALTAVYTS